MLDLDKDLLVFLSFLHVVELLWRCTCAFCGVCLVQSWMLSFCDRDVIVLCCSYNVSVQWFMGW